MLMSKGLECHLAVVLDQADLENGMDLLGVGRQHYALRKF